MLFFTREVSHILIHFNSMMAFSYSDYIGGRIESTFVHSSHSNNSTVDTSTMVQLKKAHTTWNLETGEVEILWPENASLCEGVLGKLIFVSGATKNVYKVFSTSLLQHLVWFKLNLTVVHWFWPLCSEVFLWDRFQRAGSSGRKQSLPWEWADSVKNCWVVPFEIQSSSQGSKCQVFIRSIDFI